MKHLIFPVLLALSLSACVGTSVNGSTTTGSTTSGSTSGGATVAFAQIQGIFEQRCNGCHTSNPTYTGFRAPADGLDFTDPQTIKSAASRIMRETVNSKSMPERNNITGMTDAERALVGQWIQQGANLQ